MTSFVNGKIDKDPDAELDYAFDWTDWLAESGDTIASASVSADNGAEVFQIDILGGTVVRAWVRGGDVGTKVSLTCEITTANTPPRVDDRTVFLKIKER
jgi:hypothetical protein